MFTGNIYEQVITFLNNNILMISIWYLMFGITFIHFGDEIFLDYFRISLSRQRGNLTSEMQPFSGHETHYLMK